MNNKNDFGKNIRLEMGLCRETLIYEKLQPCIMGLLRSKNKFAFFDYYQPDSRVLFELKTLNFSKTGFLFAVMNTSKLQYYDHIIFLFEYKNDNIFNFDNADTHNLYYHIYDHKRKYNTRIINDTRIPCEVIDVPIHELKLVDFTTEYIFDFTDSITEQDNITFNKLMDKYC